MNDKIVCCFPIETKVRDLDARLYLGLKCLQHFPCLLGGKAGLHYSMFRLDSPFLYFAKGLNRKVINLYQKIHDSSGKVISLDEEGGVFSPQDFTRIFLGRYHQKAVQFVDLFFVWSEKQKKILIEHNDTIDANAVIVTGHPRFDLRKPEFGDLYRMIRKKLNKDGSVSQPYILFNMNFGGANNQVSYDAFINYKKNRSGKDFDLDNFNRKYEYQKRLLEHFVQVIFRIAGKFPHLTVVVRPHPAENAKYYLKRFEKLPNVVTTREGSVQEWIVDALLVVHHDCTTGIEAVMYGKEVYSYAPVFDADIVKDIPIRVSRFVTNEEEMIRIVGQALASQSIKKEHESILKDLNIIRSIIANTSFNAAEKIAKELIIFTHNSKFTPPRKRYEEIIPTFSVRRKAFNKMRYCYARLIQKDKYIRMRSKNKFTGIGKDEIQKRIELFRKFDASIPEANLYEIRKDTFYIEKYK